MLSSEERETTITIVDSEKEWQVYSCSPKMIRRIEKAGFEPYKIDKGEDYEGRFYRIPEKRIKFAKERTMTEEQRKQASERAKKNFSKK